MAAVPITSSLAPTPAVANSEEAPAIFRSILDLVAEAQAGGLRAEAERARASAIEIYARGWDEAGRRDLAAIERRLSRLLESPRRRRRFLLG